MVLKLIKWRKAMDNRVELNNGKLVIISLENRGDAIVRQETVYTRKMTNKIRKVFENE